MKAIRNIRLIDGTGKENTEPVNILIENGKFVQIGTDISIPENASVIDGTGLFVIPGLIDMHTHIGNSPIPDYPSCASKIETYDYVQAREGFLRWGVTTVRSCGDRPEDVLSFREEEKAGKIRAPRVVCSGPFVQSPEGHPWATVFFRNEELKEKAFVFVDADAPIEEQIDRVAAKGVDFIKVFYAHLDLIKGTEDAPRMTEEQLKRVVDSAHRNGLKCACHVDGPSEMLAACKAGVDTVEHMVNIGNSEDLSVSEELLETLKEKGTVVDPTLIATYRAAGDDYSELCRAAREYVHRMYEAGVRIAVGCDSGIPMVPFGESLHDEMLCLQEAGIPAEEVIRMATLGNARILGMEESVGSIEPGKEADLVILKGDPRKDLTRTKNIALVMKQGRIVRDEL